MTRIRTAVIGTGFMGRVHLEALRRTGNVDVVAVAGTTREKALAASRGYNIPNVTDDWRGIMADPSIDAVHVTTPNNSHYAIAKAALNAGKHVLCEKPLAITVAEAQELANLQSAHGLRSAVCHNLRFFPMVQQMRQMREEGAFGEILVVQGTYSQDWLLYDTDWNWRADAAFGGPSRVMADIGSHFFDMAEHVTALKVSALCADLETFHPVRRQPDAGSETFGGRPGIDTAATQRTMTTEDFGSALFRMGRARGAMTASQVSAGRKNDLVLEIYGTKGGASWRQDQPEQLWLGHRDAPNQILLKDPALMGSAARGVSDLPGGHTEGYHDTFKQLFGHFYASVADPGLAPNYPQMADGLRQMRIVAAALESHRRQGWVDVPA